MKDSAKLLNFNVNRELKFSVFRQVDFDPRRALSFNFRRNLAFSANRDLGFGKRGVVFRGYVCPSCRAPVARDAPRCDECGIVFEQPTKRTPKNARAPPARKPAPPKRERVAERPRAEVSRPPKARSTFGCPGCGRILYVGAEQCPGCGTRFITNPPPPPKAGMGAVECVNCRYMIPPSDGFCRSCGSPRPPGNTVSWDRNTGKERWIE